MKKLTILFFILFVSTNIFAQEYSSNNKKAISAYESGQQNYQLFNFDKAETDLIKAIKIDESFSDAYYLLAGVYSQKKDTANMLATLQSCIDNCGETEPWSYFKLANEQYLLGMYDEALVNIKSLSSISLSKSKQKTYDMLYSKIVAAQEIKKHPVNFKPVNMGNNINTQYDDYHPSITIDDRTIIYTINLPTNNPRMNQEDLFIAKKEDQWQKSLPLSQINTKANEGAQSITADGKTMFFTICNAPGGFGSCDIYVTKRIGDSWLKPKNIGAPVNTSSWESQPSVSADGKTLYFASNRENGIGGKDIWISHLQNNGKWTEPENLGEPLNTKYNDESPYIHADGLTLYYASEGHLGLGKKDLFGTQKINNNSWSEPVNLGSPLNTNEDESHLIINSEGTKGYFASNRFGGFGGFDIYEFTIDKTFKVKPNPVTYVQCIVFDSETKEKLEAVINLTDLESGETTFLNISDKSTGECIVPFIENRQYALSVEKMGYLFYSETASIESFNQKTMIEIPLQQAIVGNFVVLKNIFFDTDSYNLKKESQAELVSFVKFMQQNPSINFEIGGHTDNVGNSSYNLKLSTNRAKAVYEFFILHGIDASRLTYKGFGDTKPCVPNTTEENRAKNRRTQLIITKK